ncbi:MAG: hypothetical protein IT379_13150 [Deltaproteobacteria bacterium]|nr:hypothetical protein [Deltaproteobacteria bacterium]
MTGSSHQPEDTRHDAAPPPVSAEAQLARAVAEMVERASFGPRFFLTQLAAFVRDRCPTADEAIPLVEIHLAGGESLNICHVIGLAPGWVALAVFEEHRSDGAHRMRTELVPYATIVRVTIRASATVEKRIGLHAGTPDVLVRTPEECGSSTATVENARTAQ